MPGPRICLDCGGTMLWNKVLHAWWCTECQNILDWKKGFGLVEVLNERQTFDRDR